MTKYLPWFLFLTGVQAYAQNFICDNEMIATGETYTIAILGNQLKLESNIETGQVTKTLAIDPSYQIVLTRDKKSNKPVAKLFFNRQLFTTLDKSPKQNAYNLILENKDGGKSFDYHRGFRIDEITLDDSTHQITAKLTLTLDTYLPQANGERKLTRFSNTLHCSTGR